MNEGSPSYRLVRQVITEHPEGLTARQVQDIMTDPPVRQNASKQARRSVPHHCAISWALKKMGAKVLRRIHIRNGHGHSYANVYTVANVPEGDTHGTEVE